MRLQHLGLFLRRSVIFSSVIFSGVIFSGVILDGVLIYGLDREYLRAGQRGAQ